MKKNILCYTLFIWTNSVFAQAFDLDYLMTRRYIDCRDVKYNCAILIPQFYQKGKLDSMDMLLHYWQQKCGEFSSPEIYHIRFLLSLVNHTFDEKNFSKTFFNQQTDFRKHQIERANDRYERFSMYGMDTLHLSFIQFLAKEALRKELNPAERVLAQLYLDTIKIANKTANLKQLEKEQYNNSKIQQQFFAYKDSVFKVPQIDFAYSTGYFNPLGANKILGNQMTLGVWLGWKRYRNIFDFVIDFKLGSSKQEYYTTYRDSLIASKQLNGVYSAVEYGRVLVKKNQFEFLSLIGLGIDRIQPIVSPKGSKDDSYKKLIRSPDFNFGLGCRYSYKEFGYLGIQVQYHLLNHKNHGGTDISGNAFTVKLFMGVSSSNVKRDFMEILY